MPPRSPRIVCLLRVKIESSSVVFLHALVCHEDVTASFLRLELLWPILLVLGYAVAEAVAFQFVNGKLFVFIAVFVGYFVVNLFWRLRWIDPRDFSRQCALAIPFV